MISFILLYEISISSFVKLAVVPGGEFVFKSKSRQDVKNAIVNPVGCQVKFVVCQ